VILPLLESDLLEICAACAWAARPDIRGWQKPLRRLRGMVRRLSGKVFGANADTRAGQLPRQPGIHAGTVMKEGQLLSSGGGVGGYLHRRGFANTVSAAYAALDASFPGSQYRKDIAQRPDLLRGLPVSYYQRGSNIDAATRRRPDARSVSHYDRRVLAASALWRFV